MKNKPASIRLPRVEADCFEENWDNLDDVNRILCGIREKFYGILLPAY